MGGVYYLGAEAVCLRLSGWGAGQSGCHVSRVSGLGVQVIHTYIDIILKVILSKVLESLCGLDNVFDLHAALPVMCPFNFEP